MQSVLDKITANDARNCFRHCGYTLRVEWDCSKWNWKRPWDITAFFYL